MIILDKSPSWGGLEGRVRGEGERAVMGKSARKKPVPHARPSQALVQDTHFLKSTFLIVSVSHTLTHIAMHTHAHSFLNS